MSTYLVAVVVCDFQSLANEKESPYTVWASLELKYQLPYSLAVIPKMVDFLGVRLGIPYNLPKLEMVALPDFPTEGMENWGLLIYSELVMLYDGSITPLTLKRYIRDLVTHEITHQWFGNLVTAEWWDCLWLNEAFATYFQYHAHEEVCSFS